MASDGAQVARMWRLECSRRLDQPILLGLPETVSHLFVRDELA
jgi:hypothetical protein